MFLLMPAYKLIFTDIRMYINDFFYYIINFFSFSVQHAIETARGSQLLHSSARHVA